MEVSNLKQKKELKKITRSKNKLIIQEEPNSKSKMKLFKNYVKEIMLQKKD